MRNMNLENGIKWIYNRTISGEKIGINFGVWNRIMM